MTSSIGLLSVQLVLVIKMMGGNAHHHYLYYEWWLHNTSCTYGTTLQVFTRGPEWAHVAT
jgi:hypothetical protein